MVVSKNTAQLVIDAIRNYVEPSKVAALIQDLSEIPGNKSYQDTITLIRREYLQQIRTASARERQ